MKVLAMRALIAVALIPALSTRATAQDAPRFFTAPADTTRGPVLIDPAANALLNRRVALNVRDVTLAAALKELGLTADIHFVYASDALPGVNDVRFQSGNSTVAAALTELLSGAGVDVVVTADDNIVLMRKTTARTPVVFRGTLRTSAAGTPVAGAIVILIDTLRAIRAASRSDERGRFELRSRAYGQFRLRIQRIGVRPYESALFELTGDTTAAIALNELPAVTLPRVTALAASACRDKSVAALGTWQLWEDVRTALLETSITYAEQRTKFKIARVKRVFDTQPTTMRTIAILEDTVSGAQPWTSFSPDILAQAGYVAFANDRLTFVSPDLEVMLSRSFENTHCFRPAILRDGALVGLSSSRRKVSRIAPISPARSGWTARRMSCAS